MSARLDSSHGKAGAILALVFVLGLTTGFLVLNFAVGNGAETDLHITRVSSTLEDLISHLDLQPDQTEQVCGVLDDIIMVEADLLNQVKLNQMEGRRRIMQFLEPAQQERFATLIDTGAASPTE